MYFYIPTKIYQQDGCVRAHGQELAALGSRALIVTGKHSSRKNGSLSDVVSALEAHGIPFLIFDDIEENPSVETVIKAKEAGLSFGADFVIGIGGGSPMDASKSIALLMKHPEETADFLYARGDGDSFPVAAVPTTCGTGSEATPWSILTRHELKIKQGIARPVLPSPLIPFWSPPPSTLSPTAWKAISTRTPPHIAGCSVCRASASGAKRKALWPETAPRRRRIFPT